MTVGIRWISVGPGSGFGDACERYLSGLREAGVPTTWTPLQWGPNRWFDRIGPAVDIALDHCRHADIANLDIEHDVVVVSGSPLWNERFAEETAGRLRVAFATWETDRIPAVWPSILNQYDLVLVPSQFNKATFADAKLNVPIEVVPHIAKEPTPRSPHRGMETDPYGSAFALGERTFVVYTIGTWTTRKAILDSVEAFRRAFTDADDVTFVIHTTPEDRVILNRLTRSGAPGPDRRSMTWHSLAQALGGHADVPNVLLSTRTLTSDELSSLHARGDCYLSLSRGEGWGLGSFDAAAAGNPVIVTGWSGWLDYLPPAYPYLVDYHLVATTSEEPDTWWQPVAGERWAKAHVDHAAQLLRRVARCRGEARAWGDELRAHVQSQFASSLVTARLLELVDRAAAFKSRRAR